jgi:hypothetical protein
MADRLVAKKGRGETLTDVEQELYNDLVKAAPMSLKGVVAQELGRELRQGGAGSLVSEPMRESGVTDQGVVFKRRPEDVR